MLHYDLRKALTRNSKTMSDIQRAAGWCEAAAPAGLNSPLSCILNRIRSLDGLMCKCFAFAAGCSRYRRNLTVTAGGYKTLPSPLSVFGSEEECDQSVSVMSAFPAQPVMKWSGTADYSVSIGI